MSIWNFMQFIVIFNPFQKAFKNYLPTLNGRTFLRNQRCELLRITCSHYGKLQKFSVFYRLRKTRIFLREFFKKVAIRNVAKKALNKRIWFPISEIDCVLGLLPQCVQSSITVNPWMRVVTLHGKPGKVKEFENWSGKSGNLKIDQKIRQKSENFIFPIEWQPLFFCCKYINDFKIV